ncbi:helix-turn-helix transcriptional regulator [Microtetraspora sp. AC03309]|uniref:ArsR/SmtB family transcription factor n=1 Tax=Microtetraspora sp. AC03309 TaxID=2779376 RepID=UPI001E3D90E6|nr:metalloregulator ArsR/SmtB family transcription factor [Microtetraspora sp. AC03309]MCC5575236.1 helix-turn-helix transcriptional regulator [Microtetraspora sp. AC03309]
MSREPVAVTEVFKALCDPIRWSIVQQVAQEEEFACSILEDMLPVSKPTISYHTKILTQAGVIEVRKRGRNYFYTLRRDVVREVIDELWTLAPGDRPEVGSTAEDEARQPRRPSHAETSSDNDAPLLTW